MNIAPLQLLYFGSVKDGRNNSKKTKRHPNSSATSSNKTIISKTNHSAGLSDEASSQLQNIKKLRLLSLNLLTEIENMDGQNKNDMRRAVLTQLSMIDSLRTSIINSQNIQN